MLLCLVNFLFDLSMCLAKFLCVLIYLWTLKDQYIVEISQIGRNEREKRNVWGPRRCSRNQPPRGRVMKTQLSLTRSPRLDPTCKNYDARGFTDNVLRHNIICKNVSWYKTVSGAQGIVT